MGAAVYGAAGSSARFRPFQLGSAAQDNFEPRRKRAMRRSQLKIVQLRRPSPSRVAALQPAQPLVARLDGEQVGLEGRREIVLKCGHASITLRRDGKILVRGIYVETHAKGVNRIKGGSVKVN
jgi:hypothetical protein